MTTIGFAAVWRPSANRHSRFPQAEHGFRAPCKQLAGRETDSLRIRPSGRLNLLQRRRRRRRPEQQARATHWHKDTSAAAAMNIDAVGAGRYQFLSNWPPPRSAHEVIISSRPFSSPALFAAPNFSRSRRLCYLVRSLARSFVRVREKISSCDNLTQLSCLFGWLPENEPKTSHSSGRAAALH